MKKFCLIFVLVFLTGCRGQQALVNKITAGPVAADVHQSILTDQAALDGYFSHSTTTVASEKIFGAVVTHHVLAVSVMSDLFKSLSAQKYQTIVIVGPNHFNVGHSKIIVSGEGFNTPYGVLEPDLDLAKKLDGLDDVSIDEGPFVREHAITSLVSFVKKNWPEAKFLPILVNFNTDKGLAEQIGYELAEYLPPDSLVIASCDFAHHVDRETAVKYDQDSLAGLESQDINKILKIKVDSPGSLIVLESYLKQFNAQKFQLVENTNAADILGMPDYRDVTSYIAGYFIKNK